MNHPGRAGGVVRPRLGDAGLLASDLPDTVPLVRKRLVNLAERQSSSKKVGFAVRGEPAAPGAGS